MRCIGCANKACRPCSRVGRGRRRNVAVQSVSRRAVRHREHRVLLQLLRRDPAGVGVDGNHAGPARDRGLSQFRGRQARPASRHPVQHQGRRDDLRRGRRRMGGADAGGGVVHRSIRGRGVRHPVGAARTRLPRDGHLRGYLAVHQPLAEGGLRPLRKAGRRHRHRFDRRAADPRRRPRGRAPDRVSAFARHTHCRGRCGPSSRGSWTR